MLPADQGFGPDNLPRVDQDDRLVVHLELPGLHRQGELGALRRAAHHPGTKVVVVHLRATLSMFLRRIQSQIRAPEQLGEVERNLTSAAEDHPDARQRQKVLPVKDEWRMKTLQDPLREMLDVRTVLEVLDKDGELVSTQERDGGAGAKRRLEAVPDLAQHRIAYGVTSGVVDILEVIEVDHRQRERGAASDGSGQRVLHPVLKEGAVRQAGERVVERLMRQLLLQRTPLGDVTHREHDASHARVIQQVAREHLEEQVPAFCVPQPPVRHHRRLGGPPGHA